MAERAWRLSWLAYANTFTDTRSPSQHMLHEIEEFGHKQDKCADTQEPLSGNKVICYHCGAAFSKEVTNYQVYTGTYDTDVTCYGHMSVCACVCACTSLDTRWVVRECVGVYLYIYIIHIHMHTHIHIYIYIHI